jgi:membrane protein implicated in regulation of membrane protease activity
MDMIFIWSVAIVVFLVLEGITAGLASIWFALGALAALLSALFGAPIWLQIIWFAIISGVTLYFTRPLAKKYINSRTIATNADRLIGMEGLVTEKIDNLAGTGLVSIDGKVWTARSSTEASIEAGERVTAVEIQGVKLIVSPLPAAISVE